MAPAARRACVRVQLWPIGWFFFRKGKMSFETKAKAGYGLLIVCLAIAMAVSVRRLASVTDDQVARLRREENEIGLVERLRWNSELIVSDGRGYLLSGDRELFAQVREAEARFDQNLRALNDQTLTPRGAALVAEAERAARNFRRKQEELMAARQSSGATLLVHQFETELLPLRGKLEQSVARLVGYKESALDSLYLEASLNRSRLQFRTYTLLGSVTLAGLAVALYLAILLGRSYRQERAALEAARNALAARDEVLGVVAHDLRNPLGAITMKAALLRMTPNPDKVRAQAESIEKITVRMEYLIRSMLDVTTIEAGKFSVRLETVGVDELLSETADMFEGLSASKQVRLALSSTAALAIRADRERILQVLSNLIGNALRFTPPGGRVTLSVEPQGRLVRFAVSDTGPGIRKEHLTRIFERFFKDETGKKGTGLGLFIAKGIIDAHGGTIWAESETGNGATFFFTIPVAESSGQRVNPANEAARRPPSS
jgi:signal transduction histidine kinase/CHASE3 domain sensor protein